MENEEAAIIRESLFSVLGVSGDRIKFYEESQYESLRPQIKVRVKNLPVTAPSDRRSSRLGSGTKELLYQCGEAGCMYQIVSRYIQDNKTLHGATMDAFCQSLELKLRDFELEMIPHHKLETLREILIAIRRPVERLRLLRRLVDTALTGPSLLQHLLRCNNTAGTIDSAVILEILDQSSQPWFQFLFDWTFEGRLSNSHKKFFVEEHPSAANVWTERYKMNSEMLPVGVVDAKLADLAFYVGKAVNFIRSTLSDATWSLQHQFGVDRKLDRSGRCDLGFCYDRTHNSDRLRRTLEKASEIVNERILTALKEEYGLKQHLWALKQFLLLGQGDFYTALLEGIQTEYLSMATKDVLYRHDLVAIVETALESTNAATMEREVLNRLQVELSSHNAPYAGGSKEGQRDPLDQIVFDYTVPVPLLPIVDAKEKDLYQEIFYFFFQVRRVEFQLVHMWRQSSIIQRALNVCTQRLQDRTGPEAAQAFLRQVAYAQQAMMHFILNLKSYLSFEVLQCEWDKFAEHVDQAVSVDEVVKSHDRYLQSIARKSFIKRDTELDISGRLSELLGTCKTFCGYQSAVYTEALKAVDRAAEKRREAEIKVRQGGWGFGPEKDAPEDETCFGLSNQALRHEFDNITVVFHKQMHNFLSLLRKKLHGQTAWEDIEDPSTDNLVDSPHAAELLARHDGLEDQFDLDSIRSLAYQLDSNNFYGFGASF